MAIAREDVVQWVNSVVAHSAEVTAQSVPTFDELDTTLDRVVEIYKKWLVILTGNDLIDIEPFPQYDYLAPLRVPWIVDDG